VIRTIIIDDEPNSRETLELMLVKYYPEVQITDSCSTPQEAIKSIQKHQPDLIFLDIEMPGMNGFEMLQKIQPVNFDVVFTTAYDRYAIRAIRVSALDYLLKPIDTEELDSVINHFKEKDRQSKNPLRQFEVLFEQVINKNSNNHSIALPTQEGLLIIKTGDIIRCEASGSYSKFFFTNRETLLVSRNLKEFEEILPEKEFFRIHESYIINLSFLKKYIRGDGGQAVLTDGSVLDVARRRKENFLKQIGNK
jgi:two-component system LytT family response regulator